MNPDGESLYVANEDADSVSQYDINPVSGALSPKARPTVAAGDLPEGIAVTPIGQSVYVANEFGNSVSQYDVGAGRRLSPKSPAMVATGELPVAVAVTPVPTSKAQCKHGGWRRFGFKNQGRCIHFVKRHACTAERDRIGHQAFREKYGKGRHHRHASCNCVKHAVGAR